MTTTTTAKHYDHACTNCFTDQGPCTGECAIGTEGTDKLNKLVTTVAKLLDRVIALPADADREQAALTLADALITQAIEVLPGAVEPMPEEINIAGFTIGYCDDRSAYLQADNRPGEEGVSVRIDYLSKVLSDLYVRAKLKSAKATLYIDGVEVKGFAAEEESIDLSAIDTLDIPEDVATRVIDREASFEADNDCGDACKI